jgi:hypothetical protein
MITALMCAEASWSTDRPGIPELGTIDYVTIITSGLD